MSATAEAFDDFVRLHPASAAIDATAAAAEARLLGLISSYAPRPSTPTGQGVRRA